MIIEAEKIFFSSIQISRSEEHLRRYQRSNFVPSGSLSNAALCYISEHKPPVRRRVFRYVYRSTVSYMPTQGAFLPRVSLVLEPLVPLLSLSLIHPAAPFSPPTFILMYQFHSTCVVAAVFTATPLPNLTTSFRYW